MWPCIQLHPRPGIGLYLSNCVYTMLPSQLSELQSLGRERLTSYTKAQLTDAILAADPGTTSAGDMSAILNQLKKMEEKFDSKQEDTLHAIKDLKQDLRAVKVENQQLRADVDKLTGVIASQQRYLEIVDAKERARNLFIIGVSETERLLNAETDAQKLKLIVKALGLKEEELSKLIIQCLGKARDDGKPRPVLVTMPDGQSRTSALKQAPSLKNADNNFAGIRVKKDVHPAIRREWARMFRSEEIEREKPENQGCKIEFDRRKRQILKDGEVIDTFQAHF